jgi:hypothetical protein
VRSGWENYSLLFGEYGTGEAEYTSDNVEVRIVVKLPTD